MLHDLHCFLNGHQHYAISRNGVRHVYCYRCQTPHRYTLADRLRILRYRIQNGPRKHERSILD